MGDITTPDEPIDVSQITNPGLRQKAAAAQTLAALFKASGLSTGGNLSKPPPGKNPTAEKLLGRDND